MTSNSHLSNGSAGDPVSLNNVSLRDYLETATDASRRTRFVTIAMVVASVLVLVSVLNSWDKGWISLRLDALKHRSAYAVKKFPLLCKCYDEVDPNSSICNEVESDPDNKGRFGSIEHIDTELSQLKPKRKTNPADEARANELTEERRHICDEQMFALHSFTEAMDRSAAETKFTVHVPFFGVAFDVNDVGIFGGIGLLVLLVLLRLTLRSQIVSIRVAFKEAFARDQEQDFYQVLGARQVFTFPHLGHGSQQVTPMQGWIERWWRISPVARAYKGANRLLSKPFNRTKMIVEERLRLKELRARKRLHAQCNALADYREKEETTKETEKEQSNVDKAATTATNSSATYPKDEWRANRNLALRIVPQILSLLPFLVYLSQFTIDTESRGIGIDLNAPGRTRGLLGFEAILLSAILLFGLWCITKWNELDKLWDYYREHIEDGRKLGQIKPTQ